jgi:uncharacterized membrane protein
MRARLMQVWEALRESYWFLPVLFSLVAIGVAVGAMTVDRTWGPWSFGWLPRIGPQGARALLSTTAGSLITVAGVAFSVTLVALASMSSQFGPRLLLLFLRDRGIQAALGIFAAQFLDCLVLLLFVRAAGEAADSEMFVPQVALLLAFLGGIVGIGAFIYLVHHVAQMIQVGNVVARAGTALLERIGHMETERAGEGVALLASLDDDPLPPGEPVEVCAEQDGYLQVIDSGRLMELAKEWQAVLAVQCHVGEFVTRGTVIARLWPGDDTPDDPQGAVRGTLAWGIRRTNTQDVRYLFEQLVQIAARALSTGVNDPFTAVTCMDWSEAALNRLRDLPQGAWLQVAAGEHGRVISRVTAQDELFHSALGQLIPYAATDIKATLHLAHALRRLIGAAADGEQAELLRRELGRLSLAAERRLGNPDEVAQLAAVIGTVAQAG